jgi:hypothetical protein
LLREVAIPSPEVRIKNYPHELSGGMKQRSVIAICSELMPKVVLYQGEGFEAVAYRVFSVLDAGKGCESPVEVFIEVLKYMGKSTSSYKPSP